MSCRGQGNGIVGVGADGTVDVGVVGAVGAVGAVAVGAMGALGVSPVGVGAGVEAGRDRAIGLDGIRSSAIDCCQCRCCCQRRNCWRWTVGVEAICCGSAPSWINSYRCLVLEELVIDNWFAGIGTSRGVETCWSESTLFIWRFPPAVDGECPCQCN